jgi:hypothetical protein
VIALHFTLRYAAVLCTLSAMVFTFSTLRTPGKGW